MICVQEQSSDAVFTYSNFHEVRAYYDCYTDLVRISDREW
jgi:hypothetical protein